MIREVVQEDDASASDSGLPVHSVCNQARYAYSDTTAAAAAAAGAGAASLEDLITLSLILRLSKV